MGFFSSVKKAFKEHEYGRAIGRRDYHKGMMKFYQAEVTKSHETIEADDKLAYHEKMFAIYGGIADQLEFDIKKIDRSSK